MTNTQDHWPDKPDRVTRTRKVPDDLLEANLQEALTELYHRFRSTQHRNEMSTATLARIVKDLAGLKLGREKQEKPQLPREQVVNVLALVEGLGDAQRRIKVLKAALPGAEQPEAIEAAIVELEGTVNGTDVA